MTVTSVCATTVPAGQVTVNWNVLATLAVPLELIAPTRTEGINLRGIFRFPVERYVDKILPSVAAEKTTVGRA